MATKTDIAWAAGFIDGEGCFFASITAKGSARAILSVSQRERAPLDILQGMFGGTIAKVTNKGHEAFIYTLSRKHDLGNALDLLMPYLRHKDDQAMLLRELVKHLTDHGGHGRNSTVDKVWFDARAAELKTLKT